MFCEHIAGTLTFEEDGHLWSFKGKSSYNWDIIKGCTPSNLTGPCADHTYLRNVGKYHELPSQYLSIIHLPQTYLDS